MKPKVICHYCGSEFDSSMTPVCPFCHHDNWSLSDDGGEDDLNLWDEDYHNIIDDDGEF